MIRAVTDVYADRDRLRPFFENFAAREHDHTIAAEYEADLLSGLRQAWVINDFQAVCLTKLTTDCVRITHCAGLRRHDWQEELDDVLRQWARALGKKRIVALVRPGWAKFGRSRGYKEAHREMVTEI